LQTLPELFNWNPFRQVRQTLVLGVYWVQKAIFWAGQDEGEAR
jgi:hypothetical protein